MASSDFRECIEACAACASACEHCAVACLDEDTPGPLRDCIRLDLDCAAICRLTASMLSRNSRFADAVTSICARICLECAEECERHDMTHCRDCAAACRHCAQACTAAADAAAAVPAVN